MYSIASIQVVHRNLCWNNINYIINEIDYYLGNSRIQVEVFFIYVCSAYTILIPFFVFVFFPYMWLRAYAQGHAFGLSASTSTEAKLIFRMDIL